MNGTVAPSSSSATAAATCSSRTPSSFAISRSMEVVTQAPIAMERLRRRADHSGPLPAAHMDVGSADSSTPKVAMPATRRPAESNGLAGVPSERRRQYADVGQFIASEHEVHDPLGLRVAACASRQLAEFLDHIGFARKLVLAAARRLHGLALKRAISEEHIDPHHMAQLGAARRDGGIVH